MLVSAVYIRFRENLELSDLTKIEIFCQDCKLAAPLGIFNGFGSRFCVHRRRHSCACVLLWL